MASTQVFEKRFKMAQEMAPQQKEVVLYS